MRMNIYIRISWAVKFELSDLFTVYTQKEIAQGIMLMSTDTIVVIYESHSGAQH